MFRKLIDFFFGQDDWKQVIDVYEHYYKNSNNENLSYHFLDKDGDVLNYCNANILYSKSRDLYKIEYYGNNAELHDTLLIHSNRLLCELNSKKIYPSSVDILGEIDKAFLEENYELLNKIKYRIGAK
jgi:hypothetical protein